MKFSVTFASKAWEQYLHWGDTDPATQTKINRLIADIAIGNPYQGIGKPERLVGSFSGWGSRRITQEHRLVYRIHQGGIEIAQCFGHY
jgi:toxin YoeB